MILLADAGIPMIGVVWVVGWLALLPVIAIESLVALRGLGLPFRRSLVVTAAANAVSTLVGIPLTWIALVFVEWITGGGRFLPLDTSFQRFIAVFRSAAWLPPYEGELGWMIPLAAIMLCVPFYLVSVVIEFAVVRRMVTNSRNDVWRFCWRANFASYVVIILFWILLLIEPLLHKR